MYKDVDKLIENLNDGQSELVGLERLKMLLQLLPTDEEQNTLNHYTGDSNALGQAEKFLLQLIKIADFKLRIEAMTFREEFDALMTDIEPDLDTLIQACKEVKSSSCLQRILFVLLHMGNYLNHGAVLGTLFKLNSLWKINDVRATKGNGRTLLHFVAQQVNNCWEELEKELAHIQDAAKLSFETLQSDLNDAFFQQFDSFSRSSKSRLSTATSLLKQIEEQRRELAIYFCENEKTFSMEECFKIFHAFVNRFKVASHVKNNQRANLLLAKAKKSSSKPPKIIKPNQGRLLEQTLLSSDPYTPTSKRPRHSISIPQQSLLQPAPISPRRSIVVLDSGQGQAVGHCSAGLPAGDNAPSLFKSSIKEEIESEKSSQPNNHLESFMDKALESTQITRFPVRPTEPITTSSTATIKPAKCPRKSTKNPKFLPKSLKMLLNYAKRLQFSAFHFPRRPAKDHISSTKSSTEPCRTHPILRKTPHPLPVCKKVMERLFPD
uniref:FH2 domain-containing protein n=1 Tax=Ditylenchus dipsaci TaxID=166011 RepID=A0A915D7D8_9BILA